LMCLISLMKALPTSPQPSRRPQLRLNKKK
jgi:hypothetical protein